MKILFLESELFYHKLGINTDFSTVEASFDGLKYYKNSPDFFSSYDLIVSVLYYSPLSNFVVQKANESGTKTALLIDGVFDWANVTINPVVKKTGIMTFHPIIHDVFLVIGESEKLYFESRLVNTLQYLPGRVLKVEKRMALPRVPRVLITTANTAYFNDREKRVLLSMLKRLIVKLKDRHVPIIYRIFDRELLSALSVADEDNYLSGSFQSVLASCTCVITTPSSVALSSMYHRRSVGILVFRDTPMFLQSGWLLLSGSDFDEEIESMLAMDEARLGFQDFEVGKYINGKDLEFERVLLEATEYKKQEFVKSNNRALLDSPFNLNIEYLARKVLSYIEKIEFTRGILRKLKNRCS
ncbi:MAG: hypothetical protein WBA20_03510 [Ketobacter sp.]